VSRCIQSGLHIFKCSTQRPNSPNSGTRLLRWRMVDALTSFIGLVFNLGTCNAVFTFCVSSSCPSSFPFVCFTHRLCMTVWLSVSDDIIPASCSLMTATVYCVNRLLSNDSSSTTKQPSVHSDGRSTMGATASATAISPRPGEMTDVHHSISEPVLHKRPVAPSPSIDIRFSPTRPAPSVPSPICFTTQQTQRAVNDMFSGMVSQPRSFSDPTGAHVSAGAGLYDLHRCGCHRCMALTRIAPWIDVLAGTLTQAVHAHHTGCNHAHGSLRSSCPAGEQHAAGSDHRCFPITQAHQQPGHSGSQSRSASRTRPDGEPAGETSLNRAAEEWFMFPSSLTSPSSSSSALSYPISADRQQQQQQQQQQRACAVCVHTPAESAPWLGPRRGRRFWSYSESQRNRRGVRHAAECTLFGERCKCHWKPASS